MLFVQGKAKGAFTKEDIMREISLATQNADFEACLSYLPPEVAGGKTTFVLQVPKERVDSILAHKWMLVDVFTEKEACERSSFLTGKVDVTIFRFPASSFPFEQGGGIKWDSRAFMDEGARLLVRDIMVGAKVRAAREEQQPSGFFEDIDKNTMAAWTNANVDSFDIVNIEREKYFRRGMASRVTENILIAVRLKGSLEGVKQPGKLLSPQLSLSNRNLTASPVESPAVACHVASSNEIVTRPQDLHVPADASDPQVPRQRGRCCRPQDQLQASCCDRRCEGRLQVLKLAQRWFQHCLHAVLPGARDQRALRGVVQVLDVQSAPADEGQGGESVWTRGRREGPRGKERARFQISRGGTKRRVVGPQRGREDREGSRAKRRIGQTTHSACVRAHMRSRGGGSEGLDSAGGRILQMLNPHRKPSPLAQVQEWPEVVTSIWCHRRAGATGALLRASPAASNLQAAEKCYFHDVGCVLGRNNAG